MFIVPIWCLMHGYPSFERVFGTDTGVPPYLDFLHMADDDDVRSSMAEVRGALKDSSCPEREINQLLKEANWRPNLVAAVALALRPDIDCKEALWAAFDRGSWVTPQLAVTAFLTDRNFARNAADRLLSNAPIISDGMGLVGTLERHVAMGPAGALDRSAKAMSALEVLYRQIPTPDPRVLAHLDSAETRRFIETDGDDGAGLAEGWLAKIERWRQ